MREREREREEGEEERERRRPVWRETQTSVLSECLELYKLINK